MDDSNMQNGTLEALQHDLNQIVITDEERQRIYARVADQTSAPTTSHTPVRLPVRRRFAGFTVVVAACAIALAFALAPSQLDHGAGHAVVPQSAAAEALQHAGARAAQAPWSPLAIGESQYVHGMIFAPTDPWVDTNKPLVSAADWVQRLDFEVWIGFDGSARRAGVSTLGFGPNQKHFTGDFEGTRFFIHNTQSARQIFSETWPAGGGKPHHKMNMFFAGRGHDVPTIDRRPLWDIPSDTPRDLMLKNWGITLHEINALPASGRQLSVQVNSLIRKAARRGPENQQQPHVSSGQTRAVIQHDAEISAATTMLGNAPLSPQARAAVFEYLASAKGATLDGTRTDRLGRTGTSITFASTFDRTYPAHDITDRQVLAQALKAGATWKHVKTTGEVFHVKRHRQYRKWRLTVIFAPDTGELLQTTSIERGGGGADPEIWGPAKDGSYHVQYHPQDGGYGGGATDRVYVSSAHTTNTISQMSFCIQHRDIC